MLGLRDNRLIPAFLSFDVEPDGFQLSYADPPAWPGYSAMIEIAEQLRSRLSERSGVVPSFGWYFRTDPQIAEVYGDACSALIEFGERAAQLKAKGDYFGVHCHPIRWCGERQQWVHEVADDGWTSHCTRFALDAFAQWQGSPALRFRAGGGYLSNTMLDTLERHGVGVDLSLEPVKGWWLYSTEVQTAIDSSVIVGRYPDCDNAPRVAYRPTRHDFRMLGKHNARSIVMIPHTTWDESDASFWPAAIQQLCGRSSNVQMLYPSVEWPSPGHFWHLAERRLRSMRKPYLSLGIRTDAPDSLLVRRVQQIFDALPQHPLAERLRFADPVEVAPSLIGIA